MPPSVLIHAPLGDDARALAGEVAVCGKTARICEEPEELAQIIRQDGPEAALLCVISQEGAAVVTGDVLADAFAAEPSWARLPLIFLVADVRHPPPAVRLLDRSENAPPFLVLGRPCRPAVLRHAIDTQAEARRRQFETRDLLKKLESEEQRTRFLLSEVRHRTRNSFAVLQALFGMSARRANSVEDLKDAFGERLQNLAVAHARLSELGQRKIPLSDLLKEHVLPYTISPDQLHLSGPEVLVRERMSFDLTMVIHELATNAAKYGSLSQSDGRVEVEWLPNAESDWLRLTWRERNGPPVAVPERGGLGSQLISDFPPGRQAAQVKFEPGGLIWIGWIPGDDLTAT